MKNEKMKNKKNNAKTTYITSPIYYVNAQPHIGHAYTSLACDIAARWAKMCGDEVFFATGTDEFGQKIEKTARDTNKTPQALCDEFSSHFQALGEKLNICNNDFIRTTQDRHKTQVQKLWTKLFNNGWIYKGKYEGWYAIRDEAFYDEKELINGKAPTGAEVEWKSEECYFFKLSKFGAILEKIYLEKTNFVLPKTRLNEVLSFVRGGLSDLCISRTNFNWGVGVPNNEKHVIYVWLDALTNYISILGYEGADNYNKFWVNCKNRIHFVGKDILRFHAVYWPAFLLGSFYNEDSLANATSEEIFAKVPDTIFAHGWWTKDGEKMSKSLGNVVDPNEVMEKYGLDKFRYFLFATNPFGNDGNFSEADFIAKTNADLVNNFGNLVQRTLTIVAKNFDGYIPKPSTEMETDNLFEKITPFMTQFAYDKAIGEIIKYCSTANEFIDKSAPWKLIKQGEDGKQQAGDVIYTLCENILQIATCLEAFIPDSVQKVFEVFGGRAISHSQKINQPQILFERV